MSESKPDEEANQGQPRVGRAEDFSEQASLPVESLIVEFADFLRHNKKWWMTPIFVVLIVFSVVILLTSSTIGPFIYVLF